MRPSEQPVKIQSGIQMSSGVFPLGYPGGSPQITAYMSTYTLCYFSDIVWGIVNVVLVSWRVYARKNRSEKVSVSIAEHGGEEEEEEAQDGDAALAQPQIAHLAVRCFCF